MPAGKIPQVRPPAIPGSELIDAHGLHVAIAGPPDGRPVLLLHGFAGSHATWAAVATGLARAGCRVLAADLPGHGGSTRKAACAGELSGGFSELLEEQIGATPVALVAHSLGASVAVTLAQQVPCASLALIAPAGLGRTIDATFLRGMAAPGGEDELSRLVARLSSRVPALSPPAIAALHAELSRGRLTALADSLLDEDEQTLDLVPAIDRLAHSLPISVLIGHDDLIMRWQDVFALSARVAVHHFPAAGHMPQWDEARSVTSILRDVMLRRPDG